MAFLQYYALVSIISSVLSRGYCSLISFTHSLTLLAFVLDSSKLGLTDSFLLLFIRDSPVSFWFLSLTSIGLILLRNFARRHWTFVRNLWLTLIALVLLSLAKQIDDCCPICSSVIAFFVIFASSNHSFQHYVLSLLTLVSLIETGKHGSFHLQFFLRLLQSLNSFWTAHTHPAKLESSVSVNHYIFLSVIQ